MMIEMMTFENFEKNVIVEKSFTIMEIHKKFAVTVDNIIEVLLKYMAKKHFRFINGVPNELQGKNLFCEYLVINVIGKTNNMGYIKTLNFLYVDKTGKENPLPVNARIEIIRIVSPVDPYGEEDW